MSLSPQTAANSGSGLPQFDPSHFSSEVFWEILTFLFLLFLFYRYVLPKINAILDERSMLIQKNLEDAAAKRKQGEKALAEYQLKLNSVQIEAEQMLEAARQEAAMLHERAMQQLDDDIRKKKQIVQAEIEFAKRRAMKEIRNTSADLALMAAEKLIERRIDRQLAREMVEDALRELGDTQ